MNVGAVPVNALASKVREFYVQTYVNQTFGVVNGTQYFSVGSFTTPFACAVMLNAWARFQYIGADCYIVTQASASYTNVAPTNAPPGVWQDGIPGATFNSLADVPYSAYYGSVAAGTTVNMWNQTYVGITNPFFEWHLALVRCIRL